MTHEPDKNVFSGARSQFEEIRKAINELEYAGATLPAVHEQALAVALAALHELDMSVGEIVDKLTHYGKLHIIANETLIKQAQELDSPHDGIQRVQDGLVSAIESTKSFFEGTERAAIHADIHKDDFHADAEKRSL